MPILLVTEELLRGIRKESSLALQYWFGVGTGQVWGWRRAFGVRQWETEGSIRLHRQSSAKGAAGVKRKHLTPADQTADRERSTAMNLIQFARKAGNRHRPWTKQELALLGTASDAEVAAKIGRSENAVRVKRTKVGIRRRWIGVRDNDRGGTELL